MKVKKVVQISVYYRWPRGNALLTCDQAFLFCFFCFFFRKGEGKINTGRECMIEVTKLRVSRNLRLALMAPLMVPVPKIDWLYLKIETFQAIWKQLVTLIIKKQKKAKAELLLISVSEITSTNKTLVARPGEHSLDISCSRGSLLIIKGH